MTRRQSDRAFKVGFVGCGRATSDLHLPALQHLADVEVAAVADVDVERARRVAERFGIPCAVGEYRTLLDDARLDAIAVCVPVEHHAEIAVAVLEAGRHLFVEKPLALTLGDCDRVLSASRAAAGRACVGFNLRSHRLVDDARRILQRDTLGPIEAVRGLWATSIRTRQDLPEWRDHRDRGGGVLMEIASHHFDLWRYLLDAEIEEVFARARSGRSAEQTASVSARTTDGILLEGLFCERTSDQNELEICGREGRLRLSIYRFDGLQVTGTAQTPGGLGARVRTARKLGGDLARGYTNLRAGGDFRMSYAAEWRRFVDAVRSGTPLPCSLEDGRRALEIVLAATQSADAGRPIRLEHPRSDEAAGSVSGSTAEQVS